MFFHYTQQSKNGQFIELPSAGIGRTVIIEAGNPAEADYRAQCKGMDLLSDWSSWLSQVNYPAGYKQPLLSGPTPGTRYIHYVNGAIQAITPGAISTSMGSDQPLTNQDVDPWNTVIVTRE